MRPQAENQRNARAPMASSSEIKLDSAVLDARPQDGLNPSVSGPLVPLNEAQRCRKSQRPLTARSSNLL